MVHVITHPFIWRFRSCATEKCDTGERCMKGVVNVNIMMEWAQKLRYSPVNITNTRFLPKNGNSTWYPTNMDAGTAINIWMILFKLTIYPWNLNGTTLTLRYEMSSDEQFFEKISKAIISDRRAITSHLWYEHVIQWQPDPQHHCKSVIIPGKSQRRYSTYNWLRTVQNAIFFVANSPFKWWTPTETPLPEPLDSSSSKFSPPAIKSCSKVQLDVFPLNLSSSCTTLTALLTLAFPNKVSQTLQKRHRETHSQKQ